MAELFLKDDRALLRFQRRVAAATYFIAIRLVIFPVRCAAFLAGGLQTDPDSIQKGCGEVFVPRGTVKSSTASSILSHCGII